MAKKKKRRGAPQGVDPNEKRRERLEARRQAKAEAVAAQRRAQKRERVVRWLVIAAILLGTYWILFVRGAAPDDFGGHTVEHFSTAGAGDHTGEVVDYESNPPVSGAHSGQVGACGTHATDIPDGEEVHLLEHGAIGLLYQPTHDEAEIGELEEIVASFDAHTFSAPDEDMDTPIAVTAWSHKMDLDSVDEAAIRDFIEEFRAGGDAPEAFQECPNIAEESFIQIIEEEPTPVPSEEAPSDGEGNN
ncbi:MAG TPA: DUF3105 domain-containing protein [Actinomycetota bacterium]|nr:DUF3105 domain-containing protein [Actinomycetota bacterium]